jgi:hypothetical protein
MWRMAPNGGNAAITAPSQALRYALLQRPTLQKFNGIADGSACRPAPSFAPIPSSSVVPAHHVSIDAVVDGIEPKRVG